MKIINKIPFIGKKFVKLFQSDFNTRYMHNLFYNVQTYKRGTKYPEVLYNTAIEMANLDKEDILFDLYCGIGTIGIFASSYVKKVYGIEIVEQAIEDAKENAKINNVENIEFFAGDAGKIFESLMEKKQIFPDVIIVDPPRRGLDANTIDNILAVEPKKVVYISCNPATMVRDIKLLSEKYEVKGYPTIIIFKDGTEVKRLTGLQQKPALIKALEELL